MASTAAIVPPMAPEVLWGTNVERFWPQLKFWSPDDSLIAFNIASHRGRKRQMRAAMADAQWAHIQFVRLGGPGEVERLLRRA